MSKRSESGYQNSGSAWRRVVQHVCADGFPTNREQA